MKIKKLPLATFIVASFFSTEIYSKTKMCRVTDTLGDYVKSVCNGKEQINPLAYVSLPVEGQPYYEKSQSVLGLLKGQLISITEIDSKHSSNPALFYKDGKNFNIALLRSGFGYLASSTGYLRGYQSAQNSARKARLGVWSDDRQIHPRDFIKAAARMHKIKEGMKVSEKEKAMFSKIFIADTRAKIAYKSTCPKALTIPSFKRQVFTTKQNLEFKGFTLKNCND